MNRITRSFVALAAALCVAAATPLGAQTPATAQGAAPAKASGTQPAIPQDKLDSLLAPIALYPDSLLVQTLMASTYPLDVVEASRFVKANKELKGEAMVKAAEAKNWDPSVQSLTAYPQVLEMMNDKLDWTQELGDAVLADEAAVMKTVQGLRAKAMASGNLKSSEQQKVVQQEKTIIIEPAQSQTVYVPTYNPSVVYGTWWAPAYPPYYWPPPAYYYPGYGVGAGLIGFGLGVAVGSACCWASPHWGNNDINIDVDNNFVRNNNNAEFKNKVQNGNWQHNANQRKGVAYRDQGTRDKFAKSDPGAASARRDYRGYDGGGAGNRAGAGTMDRPGAGNRAGASAGTMDRPGGAGDRAGPSAGSMDRASGIDRGDGPGAGRGGDRAGAGTMDRGGGSSFGGGGGSYNRSSGAGSFNSGQSRAQTQSYSNRGASSRSSMSGGGGGARGGGGGGRGGGGRR
ncbi:MAG: DUF3300 domain-containing protein [Burkholderiales bacterium]|nr:DUF3300 domain-containing protein [Burkholderiales bacterium]